VPEPEATQICSEETTQTLRALYELKKKAKKRGEITELKKKSSVCKQNRTVVQSREGTQSEEKRHS